MIKIKIFSDEKTATAVLQDAINDFCEKIITKGSTFAKILDIKCVVDSNDLLIYTLLYDDGESERSAT